MKKLNIVFKVIDSSDNQLHSTWHVTASKYEITTEDAKMEIAGYLTQDAKDGLDNVDIQEDLEDNGFVVSHINTIPINAEIVTVNY
jgi:hypothetical protein